MKATIQKTVLLVLLTIICVPVYSNISNDTIPANTEAQRAERLINRLEEIKNMDRSTLTPAEKRELRKEVKTIKTELKAAKGGVYLSVGAIIIIILLLILLL
ncbi:hypothetical protein [Flavobacterium suncheonense]|uniref:Seryl-tRNA synthetase n=1 Tax=Flavobacterium suncheonense GH29-5 = DSM 17707 TaxID=1121899 RepID=A0A0A2M8U0_9FLAO|nr:hypothetical protein [Flavobacterium suncheonense]KGO87878.1 hypothetical protein Q764_12030 [Flavobacterium suncheonense GH29-5 = DSM 17707]